MLGPTLARLAEQTWDEMDLAAYVLGFTPDERHFTDRNLIELTRRHRPRVFATRSGIDEFATGADFEWWIRDGGAATGLLVQAKRLTLAGSGEYREIDRPTDDGRPQPERLIATARARRMTPIYVLYNGGRPSFPPGPCGGGLWLKARGTTVTAAAHIERLAKASGTAALADVQANAIPWQCLVECPRAGHAGSLASRIFASLTANAIDDPHGQPLTSTGELDNRVRSLFSALEQLSAVPDPEGREGIRRELTAIASYDPAAPNVVVMDATDTQTE